MVGQYSKELNQLLKNYFESDDKIKDKLRPFLNYYRQLQHYLVFLGLKGTYLSLGRC
jgi:hypothetical protein